MQDPERQRIDIACAAPIHPDSPTMPVEIHIGPTSFDAPSGKAYRAFNNDAAWLANALVRSLPGGTLDVLLIRLLEHRRSQLIVPAPKGD